MRNRSRIVIDTDTLISRLLLPESLPGQAICKAVDIGHVLISEATMLELIQVLGRPQFDRYSSIENRRDFLRALGRIAEFVSVHYAIHACRDPKDDKFLELAVNGETQVIITGDVDLLALHPFRGVAISAPSEYLKARRIKRAVREGRSLRRTCR
jgi:putative PIN family toxin of toxin-antitoxin system